MMRQGILYKKIWPYGFQEVRKYKNELTPLTNKYNMTFNDVEIEFQPN